MKKGKKLKKLVRIRKKKGGRDSRGQVSVRHQGGEEKRMLRVIDWKRDKKDIAGKVAAIEYDPNRTADIALIVYPDGEKRYILAPAKLKAGDQVISADKGEIEPGNTMMIKNIPLGVPFHNLEITPGKGGQVVKSAGASALIQSVEGKWTLVKLPSGEIKKFPSQCRATIGQVSNAEWGATKLEKAGDKRHRGIRPTVRGVAQHPGAHPHGGGEGRSGIGMKAPKTPWGKKTLGKRTRKRKKYSNQLIVKKKK